MNEAKTAGDLTKPENGWTLAKVQQLLDGPLGPTNLGYVALLSALQWMMAERKRIEEKVLLLASDWEESAEDEGAIVDIGDGLGEREYDEEECSNIAIGVALARQIILGDQGEPDDAADTDDAAEG